MLAKDLGISESCLRNLMESRGTYGWPRVTAELALGLGMPVNHKRVARLMRAAGLQGLYRRRRRGCTVRDPHAEPPGG
jgi:putative transposase